LQKLNKTNKNGWLTDKPTPTTTIVSIERIIEQLVAASNMIGFNRNTAKHLIKLRTNLKTDCKCLARRKEVEQLATQNSQRPSCRKWKAYLFHPTLVGTAWK